MTDQFASCRCGQARLEMAGKPIVATVCHCSSCQKAGRSLAALADATTVMDDHGGTALVLYRKDQVRCVRGETSLAEFRLNPDSPTRRIVAKCCNTAMFLDFTKGHWVSIYRGRVSPGVSVVERKSRLFILDLMWAWATMGFRTPKIEFVRGGVLDLPV